MLFFSHLFYVNISDSEDGTNDTECCQFNNSPFCIKQSSDRGPLIC